MAVIDFTTAMTGNNLVVTWTPLTGGDTGTPYLNPTMFRLASVQFEGTFGNSTFTMEGTIDGTNYETLTDPQGAAISKGADGLLGILETPVYYRPALSGSTGAAFTTTLVFTARQPM